MVVIYTIDITTMHIVPLMMVWSIAEIIWQMSTALDSLLIMILVSLIQLHTYSYHYRSLDIHQ